MITFSYCKNVFSTVDEIYIALTTIEGIANIEKYFFPLWRLKKKQKKQKNKQTKAIGQKPKRNLGITLAIVIMENCQKIVMIININVYAIVFYNILCHWLLFLILCYVCFRQVVLLLCLLYIFYYIFKVVKVFCWTHRI